VVEYENPVLLFSEKKISSGTALVPLIEQCHNASRPLIIVAEDIDGEALSTLLLNRLRLNLRICAVKAPGFGDNRKNNLRDMAILTGGQVVSEDLGHKMEEVQLGDLGRCGKITITKDDCIILNGMGQRMILMNVLIIFDRKLHKRIARMKRKNWRKDWVSLAGGVAVIRVGGSSEVEVNEKKDRMNDSLNATKAAVAEGIVPGGGVALLYATKILDDIEALGLTNDDQKVGANIVRKAMHVPATAIIGNAGKEGAVYCGKMLETATPDSRYGYDAASDSWSDLHELGVVDPAKVVICALQDSASVAGLMTTTEAVICEYPEKNKGPPPQMDMGGPGGGF